MNLGKAIRELQVEPVEWPQPQESPPHDVPDHEHTLDLVHKELVNQ